MKQEIKISVEVPDRLKPGSTKVVFSMVKVVDDSIDFDFRSVLHGLTVLFQDQSPIILFQIL